MKAYKTNDGAVIQARNSRDACRKLRAISREPEASLSAFMKAVASRVRKQTGTRVPHDSYADFIAQLIRVGLLMETEL